MELLNSGVLASRALNASRKLHMLTYVATRFLLESVVSGNDSSWIYKTIPRKHLLRTEAPFHKILKFKKVDENGNPIYREFVVPGPTTLLSEAIILGYFAQTIQFQKSHNVYSYIWPESLDCPYNFEHYISGYKKRNDDIVDYLNLNPDKIVIISDIEKFYPSIDQVVVKERFEERLKNSNIPADIQELSNRFLDDLFSFFSDNKGVITGSEFSHVIGDVALEKIDSKLSGEYGAAYFRYVDDIVLIVDPEDKEKTINLLESLAGDEGLTINADKNDVISGDSWLKYGPHNDQGVSENSFESLVFKLKTYLQVNQNSEESLRKALTDEGFSIPIGRISGVSKSNSFVNRLIYLISSSWKVALKAVLANEGNVINDAKTVRQSLHRKILQHLESNAPEGATLRKWYLQKLRYLTNRAVYLFPHGELGFLRDKLRSFPEFVDSVALLDTLIDGDYSNLLKMPGAALNACAGILYQNDVKLGTLSITEDMTPAQIESASVLALWDVIDVDLQLINVDDYSVIEYLNVSSGSPASARNINRFTYIDEISALATHKTKEDRLHTLESRFLDTEGLVFDALDIGWNSEY